MSQQPFPPADLWSALLLFDVHCARQVRQLGCPHCAGRLHVANYPRKPRGIPRSLLGDAYLIRQSFCCAECRRRTTPPSLRFLGRKVYLGALVVLFGNTALGGTADSVAARALVRTIGTACGMAPRTLARWREWWTQQVPATRWWAALAPRLVPSVDVATLPLGLLARVQATPADPNAALSTVLGWIRPLSTRTCSHCPMFGTGTHEMV